MLRPDLSVVPVLGVFMLTLEAHNLENRPCRFKPRNLQAQTERASSAHCSPSCNFASRACCASQHLRLPGFDPEAARHTEAQFKHQGINLNPDFSPVKVVKESDGKLTMTAKNNDDKEVTVDGIDYILMATGRKPATQGLGLDQVDLCSHASHCSAYSVPSVQAHNVLLW